MGNQNPKYFCTVLSKCSLHTFLKILYWQRTVFITLFLKLHSLQGSCLSLMRYIHMFSGCMEDGTALGDVELPPWAKGDPQEFIRIHREVSNT